MKKRIVINKNVNMNKVYDVFKYLLEKISKQNITGIILYNNILVLQLRSKDFARCFQHFKLCRYCKFITI